MESRTINKQNWSGDEGTYKYNAFGVVVQGNEYKYKKTGDKIYKVTSKEHGWSEIWTIFEHNGKFFCEDLGLSRESNLVHELIAIMHWNLM